MKNLFVVYTVYDKEGMKIWNGVLLNTKKPRNMNDIINIQQEIKKMAKKEEYSITRVLLTDWKVL